jgi:hypothetical protein
MNWSVWLDPLGLFKTPKTQAPTPGDLKKNVTIADEGGTVGVLWGTKTISTTYITYFGDVKTVAIKSKSGKK